MTRKNRTRKQALNIGFWAVVALVLLIVGVNFLKGIQIFDKTTTYYMFLDDATGLDRSSGVYLNGLLVGNVRKIDFDYKGLEGAVIQMELEPELKLPQGTYGYLAASLFSNARIRLIAPPLTAQTPTLSPKDTIPSTKKVNMMDKVQNELLPRVLALTSSVDTLISDVNNLVKDPNLPQAIERINRSTRDIQSSSQQLNSLLHNEVPSILHSVDSSAVAVAELTNKVNSANVEQALSDFTSVVAELQKLSTQLNSTDNTVGLLLNDPTLYQKLQDATTSADSLLTDLKENPKRYVHFSLF